MLRMMRKRKLWLLFLGAMFLVFQSFSTLSLSRQDIPENVNDVLQTSCFGCHNSEGRNDDAKDALELDNWDGYRLTKKIGVLSEIIEVLEEDKMPPARFLESNPDRRLTEDQKKLVIDWANEESRRLMEDN